MPHTPIYRVKFTIMVTEDIIAILALAPCKKKKLIGVLLQK